MCDACFKQFTTIKCNCCGSNFCRTCDYIQYNTCFTCKKVFCIDCSKEFDIEDDYAQGERSELSRRLFPRYSCSKECNDHYAKIKKSCSSINTKSRKEISIEIGKIINSMSKL